MLSTPPYAELAFRSLRRISLGWSLRKITHHSLSVRVQDAKPHSDETSISGEQLPSREHCRCANPNNAEKGYLDVRSAVDTGP